MRHPVALWFCGLSAHAESFGARNLCGIGGPRRLGGAHRIELCSDLTSGGITPSAGLMQTARRHVRFPIHVLIRPRAGDFCYSDHELEIMRDDIQAAKGLGMDGVVLG